MAKYRHVYTNFWSDPKVQEEFTPEDKLFYLYLLTNEYTSQIGIYQITKRQIAFELGYSIESVNALMQRFIEHHELVEYDTENREIYLKNWAKYNLTKGGKPIMDCIKKELSNVKTKSFIKSSIQNIEKTDISNLFEQYDDSRNDSYDDTSTTSGQKEKEKEKEKENKKENKKEKENNIENQSSSSEIFNFYESEFGPLSNFIAEEIGYMIEDTNEELVLEALKLSVRANKRTIKYAAAITRNWRNENIKSIDDLIAAQKAKGRGRDGKNRNQTTIEYDDGVNF